MHKLKYKISNTMGAPFQQQSTHTTGWNLKTTGAQQTKKKSNWNSEILMPKKSSGCLLWCSCLFSVFQNWDDRCMALDGNLKRHLSYQFLRLNVSDFSLVSPRGYSQYNVLCLSPSGFHLANI